MFNNNKPQSVGSERISHNWGEPSINLDGQWAGLNQEWPPIIELFFSWNYAVSTLVHLSSRPPRFFFFTPSHEMQIADIVVDSLIRRILQLGMGIGFATVCRCNHHHHRESAASHRIPPLDPICISQNSRFWAAHCLPSWNCRTAGLTTGAAACTWS